MHSIEAEQSLLGAALITPEVLDRLPALRSDHFFEPIHKKIYEEIRRRADKGERVTPLLLEDTFSPTMDIGGMPFRQYVARLCSEATTIINAPDYGRHVRRYSVARAFVALLQDLNAHREDFFALDQALERAFHAVDELRLEAADRRVLNTVSVGDATAVVLERLTRRLQGEPSTAVLTGLTMLDRRLSGGLHLGSLILGAGRPGSGKTSLGSGVALAAARQGIGAGLFSLEMPEEEISVRLLADCAFDYRAPITYNRILADHVNSTEQQQLVDAQRTLREVPLEIDTSSHLTVPELAAKARGMRKKLAAKGAELRLLVVDYLKFLVPSDEWRGNKNLQVGEISAALKQLAKDEGLAVFLLCQLNRDVEKRENKRPILSDLRDSGELEADADVVLFLYREAYYLQNDPQLAKSGPEAAEKQTRLLQVINDLEINVAKQRMGPTGPLLVYCNMGCSAVRNRDAAETAPEADLF
jgi:replicative DNA helicase